MPRLDWKPKDLRLQEQFGEEEVKLDFLKDLTSWQLPFGGGQTFGQLGQGFRQIGERGLELGLKGLDWALTPAAFIGQTNIETLERQLEQADLTPEERRQRYLEITRLPTTGEVSTRLRGILPGGELREAYRERPLWQQLLAEAPFWMMAAPVTATGIRAALAPAAARGGARAILPEAGRVALAPIAGVEQAIALGLKYGVGVPIKYGGVKSVTLARKSFEKALDTGLDRWLVRQGIRGDQANAIVKKFLEVNGRQFYKMAEANWLKRVAEKKGLDKTVVNATVDTMKQIEPLLLQASKDVAPAKPPAVTRPPVTPEVTPPVEAVIPRPLELPIGQTPEPVTAQLLGGAGKASLPEPIQNWLGDRTITEGIRSATAKLKVYTEKETSSALAQSQIISDLLTQLRVAEEPLGVAFLKAPEPMKTYKQLVRAHAIAKQKQLMTEDGKAKPQYRFFAQMMTGKKSMKDMTEQEAATFIEALEKLPEPTYKAGKLVPPSIPTTKKVVPENYFQMEFKEPTLVKLFTSQTYYAQKLGVKPLVQPLEMAKQRFDLEVVAFKNAIAGKVQVIDKLAKTSLGEKTAAKLANRPTEAVAEMRNLLDTYEDPPDFLSDELRPVFTWFRNLTKTMLNGENEVRRLLNMPEIQGRKAYVRHVADGLAYEIMRGKYPLPEGLKYWSSELVGNKVFNPMERHRQLSSDLEEYYTKDLTYAMNSMVYTALKEIHLSQPLRSFTEQLSAVSKDLPVYKNLSSQEINALKSIDVIPASTKRWVNDYVNQVIKGQPTGLDEQVNRMMVNKGIAGVFNFFLKPFGRSLGSMPITKLAQIQGRMVIAGAMGWRPKQLIRNKFQLVQNLALYNVRANLKSVFPASGALEELLNESLFLRGYTGMEELPLGLQGKLERDWLAPFQWTARTNAESGMKAAFYDISELVTSPKYAEYGWADPQRTYTEPKGFLYPSEREKLLYEMEFGAGATQYQYIGIGMPEIFRHKVLVPVTRLQSWWMNYFFKFHREAITRAFTGQTSYGAKLPWSRRLGWFRYLILGGAVLVPMGYTTSYLAGVLPSRLAPVAQVMMATYEYATSKNDWQRTQALRKLYSSWQVMVPTGLAFKEFREVFIGERPWQNLFFYGGKLVPEEAEPPRTGRRKYVVPAGRRE